MIRSQTPDVDPATAQREFNKILQALNRNSIALNRGASHTTAAKHFEVGDHVSWHSAAGQVSGTISKVVTSEIEFRGYNVHASKGEPEYEVKSDKADHIAMHKGSALRKIVS